MKWLDDEFKDVIDAVFFVDSEDELADILQTFAQEIAGSFFGNKVKVSEGEKHSAGEEAAHDFRRGCEGGTCVAASGLDTDWVSTSLSRSEPAL